MKERLTYLLIGALLATCLLTGLAATRQELYSHFGPHLIDALVRSIRKRDNQMRDSQAAISTELNKLIVFANDRGMVPVGTATTVPAELTGPMILDSIAGELESIKENNDSWVQPE